LYSLLVDLVELLSLWVPEEDHDLVKAEERFEKLVHALIEGDEVPQWHDFSDYGIKSDRLTVR
jgi:hypothetical protein